MKTTTVAAPFFLLALVAGTAQASLISVNLWSIGKPSAPSAWIDADPDVQAANRATLTIENGETAGVWATSEWQNVDLGSPFGTSTAATALTGSGGSTATLEIFDRRNSGPYNWNSLRDDSDVVSVGNATLFDGHTNGTEVDGGGGNPWPVAITDLEIRDISFAAYDLILYFSGNGAQYGSGGMNVRVSGQFPADPLDPADQSVGVTNFTLLPGEPNGTLDEVTGAGDTGNYMVFPGLTDPSFRAQVWGDGFNHLGVAGFQIQEVPEPSSILFLGLGGLLLARRRRA